MLRDLIDKLDDLPVATLGYVLGCLFGGVYLVVELVVGAGDVPDDFTLTPAVYFAFVTAGGGVLGIGRGILGGKRADAEGALDDPELEDAHSEQRSRIGEGGAGGVPLAAE